MRGKLFLARCGLVVCSGVASAQFPAQQPPSFPTSPAFPQPIAPAQTPPNPLPPLRPIAPAQSGQPLGQSGLPPGQFGLPSRPGVPPLGGSRPDASSANPIAQPQEIPLPQKENKLALNSSDVTLKRIQGAWQLWAGQRMLRDFGDRETDARDALRVFRDLHPTEWVSIGGPVPIVEYALVNGRPPAMLGNPGADDSKQPQVQRPGGAMIANTGGQAATGNGAGFGSGPAVTGAGAKQIIPIDFRSVRVEAVRGVWCLRDDSNIHFNFGPNKADADQTLAVVRRYGFNRIGIVGTPNPVMTYFFVGPEGAAAPAQGPFVQASLQAQIDSLNRVGIPVPGVGYVGEMVRVEPRKLEVRKVGADWVVVSGTEVLGRYGATEMAAREAAKVIADARFTEFCKIGSTGLTFFLVDGKAPNRVPYSVQGRRFDTSALKVGQFGSAYAITENGRHLIDCATSEEGEILIRVIKHFQFDQLCHMGPSQKLGLSFLAKGR